MPPKKRALDVRKRCVIMLITLLDGLLDLDHLRRDFEAAPAEHLALLGDVWEALFANGRSPCGARALRRSS